MNRKDIAQETVHIQQQGYYAYNGTTVEIADAQRRSEKAARLFRPEDGAEILQRLSVPADGPWASLKVTGRATVAAILDHAASGIVPGVLNFASAKNPGGGFLGGAMAQEESLAASSGLYHTLLRCPDYYALNRSCGTMCYTDHAIYSPEVVFFRDENAGLLPAPALASVLTLPAVNYGQVLLKSEDQTLAREIMKHRMRLCLALFAHMGDRHLVLGAYGCGVFRNDPALVARWWRQLLLEEGYGRLFDHIEFAVLDRTKNQSCLQAFVDVFPGEVA